MEDWHKLKASERKEPEFVEYFRKFKLEDMRDRMAKYFVQELGQGEEEPYLQNIPEAVNAMLKEWNNFVPQELYRSVVSLHEFVESNTMETELACFGQSDKWEVSDEFKQHILRQQYGEMTREERENAMKAMSKLCPDPNAYKKCRSFKFKQPSSTSSSHTPSTVVTVARASSIGDLAQLEGQFPEKKYPAFQKRLSPFLQQGLLRRLSNWLIFSLQWCLTTLQRTAFEEWQVFQFLQFFSLVTVCVSIVS